MAINFIQATALTGGYATTYNKLIANPAAGNTLIIVVCGGGNSLCHFILTDNFSDVFTPLTSTGACQTWIALNVHGGATTLSFNNGADSQYCQGTVVEYSGVASMRGLGYSPIAQTGSGPYTWTQGNAVQTQHNGDVIVAWFQTNTNNGAFTAGSGYTLRATGGLSWVGLEDQTIVTAGSNAAPTMTSSLAFSNPSSCGSIVLSAPFVSAVPNGLMMMGAGV